MYRRRYSAGRRPAVRLPRLGVLPTEDSDVDLLVILPFDGKAVAKSVEMRLKIRPPSPWTCWCGAGDNP